MYYNLLPKIKNAVRARKESLVTQFSKTDYAIARILVEAGFLKSAHRKDSGKKSFLEIKLNNGDARADIEFKLVSRPSRKIYVGYGELAPVKHGTGLGVISTSKGIMTNREAKFTKIGGEYLFQIW